MLRSQLRQVLREQRQQLLPAIRTQASIAICKRVEALALIQPKQKIALYKAYGSEADITALAEYARRIGAEVFLPVLPTTGRILSFTAVSAPGFWRKNALGITEWITDQQLPPHALDSAFIPLLGFDLAGNRLGQGGGYYDASFAFLLQRPANKTTRLFGVAFECQKQDHISVETWDVPLHGVITEQVYYEIK